MLAALAACAARPEPDPGQPPAGAEPAAAWRMTLPLPHQGSVADLTRWWQQFDDPLVAELVAQAETVAPTLAQARARIAQARATRVQTGAALGPIVNANGQLQRGIDLASPLGTAVGVNFQASWEADLFGGNRAAREAAESRLGGAEADWHAARISVAAEVAGDYLALRACEAQEKQVQADADSRSETARLTDLLMKSGFQSPANAALSRASAAQGHAQVVAQHAQCDLLVKAIVSLTGQDELALRGRLAPNVGRLPQPVDIEVPAVPAAALAQRPDLRSAESELLATAYDVTQTRATRLPRVTLAGSIGPAHFDGGSPALSGGGWIWTLGPLAVTMPVFDGGTRRANIAAARERYESAAAAYRADVRQAVREVEEALVNLKSAESRTHDAGVAVEGFDASLTATEALYKGGLSNLFQLEQARRDAVAAQISLIDLRRARVQAWISLYRALGGGWTPATPLPPAG